MGNAPGLSASIGRDLGQARGRPVVRDVRVAHRGDAAGEGFLDAILVRVAQAQDPRVDRSANRLRGVADALAKNLDVLGGIEVQVTVLDDDADGLVPRLGLRDAAQGQGGDGRGE